MSNDGDLSVSFIQVGSSSSAAAWLKKLDDDLVDHGAKFDIVDMLTSDELKGVGFNKMIENSINDWGRSRMDDTCVVCNKNKYKKI